VLPFFVADSGRVRVIRSRMTTELIGLPDGRTLACELHGPANGSPLLYFHGAPSARIEPELFGLPAIASELRIRLIAPDRPGLGQSDYLPRRRISDWPEDVVRVADHFGLDRFSVLGFSGGGPYALACAQQISDRLESVVIVSSTGPHEIPGLTDEINKNSLQFMRMSVERPLFARLISRGMGLTARYFPEKMAEQAIEALPDADARFMREPGNGAMFARMVAESARRNGRGPQLDTALMVRPWGVDLSRIALPVRLWHGTEDRNAPIAMARYLAERLPDCRPTYVTGEGHLSVMARHAREILSPISQN
jgi:pimeloyl-ACP methyl ester carboxylesterase